MNRNKLIIEEANDFLRDCTTLGVSFSKSDANAINAICDIFKGD